MTRPVVRGPVVDAQTRCIHYATPLDIIAIEFDCCRTFYPCHRCHDESTDHAARPWGADAGAHPAVLCGVCGHLLTIDAYATASACPACGGAFNPGCKLHWELYFDPMLRG